jgi:hypothetical protein
MAQAPETDRPEAEQITFELERLILSADDRLELTGRWFGVRGRRFVRPTLTLIGPHKRSRSLADLEHKPWAAEDGTDWIAVFPLQSPGERVLELELAVAPDIAVSLSPPPELAQLAQERKPSRNAVAAARNAPAPAQEAPLPETSVQPPKGKAGTRRGVTALTRETIEQQRLKIQSLEEELARAAGSEVELRSALARRDAAVEKLEAVLEQQQTQTRERKVAEGDRKDAERERLTALRERDDARRSWIKAHEGLVEAVRERDRISQERDQALIERDRAMAARDQIVSELDRLARERDRALDERDQAMAGRERALDERELARAERDRALSAHDRGPAEPVLPAIPRLVMAQPDHRPRVAESRRARPAVLWATRLFALVVLLAAVAAIAIIIHSA